MDKLTGQVELLTASHRAYSEKLEQSRIDREVDDEQISNVNVAQHAMVVDRPVSPNKTIVIALGLFIALFGSVGLAFISDYLDETFKSPGEVEAFLEVPVLLSIPRVAQHNVLLN